MWYHTVYINSIGTMLVVDKSYHMICLARWKWKQKTFYHFMIMWNYLLTCVSTGMVHHMCVHMQCHFQCCNYPLYILYKSPVGKVIQETLTKLFQFVMKNTLWFHQWIGHNLLCFIARILLDTGGYHFIIMVWTCELCCLWK